PLFLFSFHDPPTPAPYTLSLHDALPILALGERGADDGQVGEFAREASVLRHHWIGKSVRILRGLPRGQFALAPLPLRCDVHGGEVAAVVLEDVEPTLSLGQTVVVDPIGREL